MQPFFHNECVNLNRVKAAIYFHGVYYISMLLLRLYDETFLLLVSKWNKEVNSNTTALKVAYDYRNFNTKSCLAVAHSLKINLII